MDNFHDDDACHKNKGDDDKNSQSNDRSGSRLLEPVSQALAPLLIAQADNDDSPAENEWIARVVSDIPEGFHYDETRDRIIDCETGRAICGPLRVAARLSDPAKSYWHLVLEFRDPNGNIQEVVYSSGNLAASAKGLAICLANRRFVLCGTATALGCFIRAARPQAIGTVLLKPGYAQLGDGTPIYADRNGTVFRPPSAAGELIRTVGLLGEVKTAGTLHSWQAEVASLAEGNPILMLGIAAAFVGPLLDLANAAPIGVNFYGATTSGILPWDKEAVREAIVTLARIWLADQSGEVSQRSRRIVEQIRADRHSFIEFESPEGASHTDTGWQTPEWYHMLPAAFDRYAGAYPQSAARDLETDGILRRGTEANCLLSRISVPGSKERQRVYSFRRTAILDALGLAED